VEGIAWAALRSSGLDLPSEIATALAADAAAIAAKSLQSAAASRDLLHAFEAAGIPVLFVKGLTLGRLAYGNAALKSAVDTDLLVAEEAIAAAAEVLGDHGYRAVIPDGPLAGERLRRWHQRHKESMWTSPDVPCAVDLHTRLADNRSLIPTIGLSSPRQLVEVAPGISLPTLADDELFAYLCVHGASSAWFRLKWISDLAGLIDSQPVAETARLRARAIALGTGRAVDQALLLAKRLFATPLPPIHADRATRALASAALRQLAQSSEPTGRPCGTWRIHWTQLLLKKGVAYKAGEVARQAVATRRR
jgi:hypothetical protein